MLLNQITKNSFMIVCEKNINAVYSVKKGIDLIHWRLKFCCDWELIKEKSFYDYFLII
jgi:hypothetical protein